MLASIVDSSSRQICREHDLMKILLVECQIVRVQCFFVLILVVHHRWARHFHNWKHKYNEYHSRVLHSGGRVTFHEKWSFVVNHKCPGLFSYWVNQLKKQKSSWKTDMNVVSLPLLQNSAKTDCIPSSWRVVSEWHGIPLAGLLVNFLWHWLSPGLSQSWREALKVLSLIEEPSEIPYDV